MEGINSIIFYFKRLYGIQTYRLVMKTVVAIFCLLLLIIPAQQTTFDLSKLGKAGTKLSATGCNIQTTLDFSFDSSVNIGSSTFGSSVFKFLTAAGSDVSLPLTAASYETSGTATSFVVGYGSRTTIANTTVTPTAAVIFKFSDSSNTVYVYIPFVSGSSTTNSKNPDVIDFTNTNAIGTFLLKSFTSTSPLSAFNILNQNNYNLWYTAVSGTTTILVSNYIYLIDSTATASAGPSTLATDINTPSWTTEIPLSGDKLCYASTITIGNFQTHIRESVPLWFIWFWIFIYWLFYLCSDSTNVKVYDNHYEDNRWTCSSLYSLANLAHEECYTRLSRSTVILINWSIQGVIIACIYGNQFLDAPMIIWTAVIGFVATIPVPFLLGYLLLRKIYEKNLKKYDNMKAMKGIFDKSKIEPIEQEIDTIEEKLYGYYHWFYSTALIVLFVAWPIAVNQMQKLPRTLYHYHWYWLASMGIVFVLEYVIWEPLIALIFGETRGVRYRGGHFYNFRLGQAYRAAQTY